VTSAEVRSARDETLTALEHQAEESREAQAALTDQVEQLGRDVQRTAPSASGGLDDLRARLSAVPGVEVTEAAGSLQVRFGEPVFTEATVVSPAGSGALAALADAMTAAMSAGGDRYLTVVTGHTDGLPLPAASRFGDNEGLARERARTAVSILVTAGLPADAVSVDVAPSPPPFPSDQQRNRSVTLTVYEAGE
jgi:flagellar motor protein MotB